MKLLALLRGVNVSGKNKIDMKVLKSCFEELGYSSVVTVLNSGNIVFDTTDDCTKSATTDSTQSDVLTKATITSAPVGSAADSVTGAPVGITADSVTSAPVGSAADSVNKIQSDTLTNISDITKNISSMIFRKFNINIPVLVITVDELTDILNHAPTWWGTENRENKETYDDLIFIFPQYTFTEVKKELGDCKSKIEQIQNYKNVIFWSFNLKDYRKSSWYTNSALPPVKDKITIRTAGTVKKLVTKK